MPSTKTTVAANDVMPPFKLGTVEASDPPPGGDGRSWYRYTILQGRNTITGYRRGSQRAVRKAVNEMVADLNERRGGRKGRVHLKPSGRPKAAASK